jgi:hypothetical protein
MDEEIEWRDAQDVNTIFSIKPTMLRELVQDGLVESVLLEAKGNRRKQRLYNFDSIRKYLNSLPTNERNPSNLWKERGRT